MPEMGSIFGYPAQGIESEPEAYRSLIFPVAVNELGEFSMAVPSIFQDAADNLKKDIDSSLMPQNMLDLDPHYSWDTEGATQDQTGLNGMVPRRKDRRRPLSEYLQINAQGGGSPMRRLGDGVRGSNYNASGDVQANIPINQMSPDALLKLRAGGYLYGGDLQFSDELQDYGLPAKESYGDGVISNVGVGLETGNHEFSADYNLQDKGSWPYLKYKYRF